MDVFACVKDCFMEGDGQPLPCTVLYENSLGSKLEGRPRDQVKSTFLRGGGRLCSTVRQSFESDILNSCLIAATHSGIISKRLM